MNSRQKGARFEREVLNKLKERTGVRGRRTSDGYNQADRGDIIHPALEQYNVECKHREKIALAEWIAQSEQDAANHKEPIVVWRTNKIKARVDMTLEHFLELVIGGSNA